MVTSRYWLALGLLLSFVPLVLPAQESDLLGSQGKVLLYVDQQAKGGFTENQLLLVSRSLLLSLQASLTGLSISDATGSIHAVSPGDLSDLAVKSGADFWLWVELSADAEETHYRVRGFDILTREAKFDTPINRDGGISVVDLPYEKWDDLVSILRSSLPARKTGIVNLPGPRDVTLTVRALPGTLVTGPGGRKTTAGEDGYAQLSLAAPGEYTVRSTHAGYYPDNSRFFMNGDKEIVLSQIPASWWAIDASLLEMGYPSFDVTRFIFPNSFYVKLGLTSYAVGLALTDTQVFTSNPLTNLVLQTGIYLRREDVVFRPYANLGLFLRIVTAPGELFGIDPLSWGGLQASIGTEIGNSPRGRFFFEYQPMLYATSVPGLFQASLGSGDPPNGWTFSDKSAFNFLCFRFGYRWLF